MPLPTALTCQYTSLSEINALLSQDTAESHVDDDQDATLDASESDFITINAVNYATGRVNLFLLQRYTADQLEDSWQVHEWATTIAAVWLSRRRGNPVPTSLAEAAELAVEEMQAVADGTLSLGDIAERESDQPCLSNLTLDSRYTVKKLRRQGPISDPRPSAIPPNRHWPSEFIGPAEDGIR